MQYFVKIADGEKSGPYSLAEIVERFGDDVEVIRAEETECARSAADVDLDSKARTSIPTQVELPELPKIDGAMVLGVIALLASLVGTCSIAVGFIASFGQPRENAMTYAVFGMLGVLINAVAVLVSLCAMIVRPSTLPITAFVIAMLSSAAFLCIPPQTSPRPQSSLNAQDDIVRYSGPSGIKMGPSK